MTNFINTKKMKYKEFDFNGVWITNPFLDESGRFEVDPKTYYNIDIKKWKIK